jgi:two-component system phosphate regulon sensor histidine kinase PhoR
VQRVTVFRSRFFWRLYATYILLVLATTIVVGVLVHHQMARSLLAETAMALKDKTILTEPYAARLFEFGVSEEVQQEIDRIGHRTGTRITLIAPDGTVLADSEKDPALMDNHGDRPEVLAALTKPFGISRRYSQTIKQHMLYIARTLRDGHLITGTLRTSMPLSAIDARLATMRTTIALGAGFGVLVALLVGMVVARRVTAPIAEMTTVAAAMRDGQYGARVRNMPADEIGLLGDTLNRLGTEATRRIATISHDQAQLRAMIAGMVEGVIAVDDQDRILHCNRAARALLDIGDLAVAGRRFWEVIRLAELVELLGEARTRREPVRREVSLYRGPTELVLEAHATAFATPDTGGLVMVLHNISDLRRLERIRRDFVANVSHELKTPLTSIKGYVETLLTGALHDERNNMRFLEKIDTHVMRLTELVRDLLSLASIESREGQLALAPVEWQPIIDGAVRRHENAFEQKSLSCSVVGACDPVLGEPEGMTQVVDNLLDNAIKYSPPNAAVHIRLGTANGHGYIQVEDSGIGIPEEDRERIFERFYRVDKARSRDLGGTGLGLSIVKHFVQAMQGQIRVDSEVGKGSRFTVDLPLAT